MLFDTSPSYLLFQTLLPLFWTLTCMILMELTRTNVVFSRITMVLFYMQKTNFLGMTWNSTEHLRKNNKKSLPKNQGQGAHTLSTRVEARPPPWACPLPRGPPGVPLTSTQLHIFTFGEKKIREKVSSRFTTRSRHQALISLGRADLESVRGFGEGIHRHRHHQPSSITNFMMLTACVSNSIIGLLDGDGLDEIYHVIELVLLGFDP